MERAVPIFPVEDLRVAKAFYTDGLGFRVVFEATEDGRTGLIGVARGTIEITLDCPMEGHGRNACAGVHVDDADAYYDEWHERVEITSPPENQPWGARTFGVQDPDGNTLFLMGPTT